VPAALLRPGQIVRRPAALGVDETAGDVARRLLHHFGRTGRLDAWVSILERRLVALVRQSQAGGTAAPALDPVRRIAELIDADGAGVRIGRWNRLGIGHPYALLWNFA
jgi:hypothetical protein